MESQEQTIYLVGANQLQNQLMAGQIAQELGVACQLRRRLSEVPRDGGAARLVLCDCFHQGCQELGELLAQLDARPSEREMRVLFNLAQDCAIEPAALDCGVRGFFYAHEDPAILPRLIRALLQGDLWLSRDKLAACLRERSTAARHTPPDAPLLTRREQQVLRLLASGASNQAIADQLFISPHTVKTHLYNLFRKLKVRNRLQAVRWASRQLD